MTHKSCLGTIVIDCQTDDVDAAADFWSKALGYESTRVEEVLGAKYRRLKTPAMQPSVLVQAVTHASRVHLDIETNDVAAEVARLERLGARRIAQVKHWWVMEAPTGQRFCVVPAYRAGFDDVANRWEQGVEKA